MSKTQFNTIKEAIDHCFEIPPKGFNMTSLATWVISQHKRGVITVRELKEVKGVKK